MIFFLLINLNITFFITFVYYIRFGYQYGYHMSSSMNWKKTEFTLFIEDLWTNWFFLLCFNQPKLGQCNESAFVLVPINCLFSKSSLEFRCATLKFSAVQKKFKSMKLFVVCIICIIVYLHNFARLMSKGNWCFLEKQFYLQLLFAERNELFIQYRR
jgi:hypothetical protein